MFQSFTWLLLLWSFGFGSHVVCSFAIEYEQHTKSLNSAMILVTHNMAPNEQAPTIAPCKMARYVDMKTRFLL